MEFLGFGGGVIEFPKSRMFRVPGFRAAEIPYRSPYPNPYSSPLTEPYSNYEGPLLYPAKPQLLGSRTL